MDIKLFRQIPNYQQDQKKLIPHEEESSKLRRIFALYLELKSVQELMYRLEDKGIVTRNNKAFTAGNLYSLLKRKIYIGKLEHKKEVYDGIHEPIIDLDISFILAGKLYDDHDNIPKPLSKER